MYNSVNTERKVTGYNIRKFIKAITGIPKNIPVRTIKTTSYSRYAIFFPHLDLSFNTLCTLQHLFINRYQVNSVVIGVTNRRLGNGPIRIGHRTAVQVNCFVHSCWARDVPVVSCQTIIEFTQIEITQYELGCIGRKTVTFLCYVTYMLGSAIHVGSEVYVNNSHKPLWTFAEEISGRSDTDSSSMSGVQSGSRTLTVLHQRPLTYKQTPPPFAFPVVCLSRSSWVGHPNHNKSR